MTKSITGECTECGSVLCPDDKCSRYFQKPSAPKKKAQKRKYVLWSDEHQQFWKPDSQGYTKSFGRAGRYTKEEVKYHCRNSHPSKGMVGLKVGANYLERRDG